MGATKPLPDEAEKLLALGLKALKLRLGYPTLTEDLAALDAVRNRVGAGVAMWSITTPGIDPG